MQVRGRLMRCGLCRYKYGINEKKAMQVRGGLMRCRLRICESKVDFDHYAVVLFCCNTGNIN